MTVRSVTRSPTPLLFLFPVATPILTVVFSKECFPIVIQLGLTESNLVTPVTPTYERLIRNQAAVDWARI